MLKFIFTFLSFFASIILFAQDEVEVYPSNWWVGMKHNQLQLMLRQPGIAANEGVTVEGPGVSLKKLTKPENPNYLFLDIAISPAAKPGKFKITIRRKGKPVVILYELKARRSGKGKTFAQGVTSSDFIYLAMPDRFSNGDPSNDRVPGMRDQSLNRDSMYHRHGGDIQGIINHLGYLQDMGVTALWLTPVLENDMPNRTEHGYAITNHYKVDTRLGGEKAYQQLIDELHKRGMKIIQDAVYNHIGLYHFTVQDPPMKDWLHQWDAFTQTNYKDQVLMDPYASAKERKIMSDGWFTREMPDVNHSNPFAAQYLIQHALWSVETFALDGWRIDTYIYNDLDFMNRCNKELMDEYPAITLFGETMVHSTANQAFFAENNINNGYKSNLPAVTDFQTLFYGISPALNEAFGWTAGVNKLYQTLCNDYLYKDANRNVIFLDNHDVTRFFTVVNEDTGKLKMGIAWLLTCRGIPQLYYGTEVLLKGASNPDGLLRGDFPGGWAEDTQNKFTPQGRNEKEEGVFDWTKRIANFRKTSSAIKTGKMMQYLPKDGLYVYFRYDAKQTVMCVMNTADKEMTVNFADYSERTKGFTKGVDIVSGNSIGADSKIAAKTMMVLELKR
jgi:neopullulanase